MKRGKRYRALREQIDRTREYPPGEAISTVKATQAAKFTEAVEVHIRLGVNVRHADQQVRGTMVLPHGLGKEVAVAVFAQGDKAREAEAAGADAVSVSLRSPDGAPATFRRTLAAARIYVQFRWLGDRPEKTVLEKTLWRFDHLRGAAKKLGLL